MVDGIVKSGKTTTARHLVPYFAVQHASGFFKPNTVSVYIDLFILSSKQTFEGMWLHGTEVRMLMQCRVQTCGM